MLSRCASSTPAWHKVTQQVVARHEQLAFVACGQGVGEVAARPGMGIGAEFHVQQRIEVFGREFFKAHLQRVFPLRWRQSMARALMVRWCRSGLGAQGFALGSGLCHLVADVARQRLAGGHGAPAASRAGARRSRAVAVGRGLHGGPGAAGARRRRLARCQPRIPQGCIGQRQRFGALRPKSASVLHCRVASCQVQWAL